MKPISIGQIDSLIGAKQNFCDCYLVSSLSALARTQRGRNILQQNVLTDGDAFCVRFNNVYGNAEQYLVRQEECDNLVLTDKYLEPIALRIPHNPLVKVFEVAMTKLLKCHYFKKPISSRMIECREIFEYNRPSVFMEMFTGIRPVTLNETSMSNTLRGKKDSLKVLLDRISDDEGGAFVAGTGFTFLNARFRSWHCYNIDNIDKNTQVVLLNDNKYQHKLRADYDDIRSKFKFICGYFGDML
ncbi:hypothetical protein II906_02255 [bacterium]|nr:hypothetical protein [bacterium]